MENKAPGRKLPLNFFDIIIILLVIIIAGVYVVTQMAGNSSDTEQNQAAAGKVEYTVEIVNLTEGTDGLINQGDAIVDKIKKYNIGTVESVDFYPMTKDAVDYENGKTVYTEVPGKYAASIKILADCSETDSKVLVDGGFEVRVGTEMSIVGPGYSGAGYIVGVTRGDV